jgi:putative tryptophan/tyrosine transport system substrate-binding protein
MRRRAFIAWLGAGAALSTVRPLTLRAEQGVVVGVLDSASAEENPYFLAVAREGLNEAGYGGENVTIAYRWAEGHYDQLPTLAHDLLGWQPAALFAAGLPAALALKAATLTIPVVFVVGPDPVSVGLVTNLTRPYGNMTGVSLYTPALVRRRLELLHELSPAAVPIGFLVNPDSAMAQSDLGDVEAAARALGQQIEVLQVGGDADLYALQATIMQRNVRALLVGNDPFINSRSPQIISIAASVAIPAIYGLTEYAAAGGLMSCNVSLNDAYRLGFNYVGAILKGKKPGDLPVLRPTKFQLVVNLKIASVLGLTVPPALLAAADEVIK